MYNFLYFILHILVAMRSDAECEQDWNGVCVPMYQCTKRVVPASIVLCNKETTYVCCDKNHVTTN